MLDAELALKVEPIISAKAKANQIAAGGAVPQKSVKAVDTQKELAKLEDHFHPPHTRSLFSLKTRT